MRKIPTLVCITFSTLLFHFAMTRIPNYFTKKPWVLFFLLTLLPSANANADDASQPFRTFSETVETENLKHLTQTFGNNKILPKGFELQALLALSYFPELRDVKIKFILADVSIPLSSRPYWRSLFKSSKNRTYHVIIDKNLESESNRGRDALLLKNQPFNAQIGILGHELSHTAYYLDRSFFGIAKDALCQFSKCRINFERNTDLRLIDHGLGWQRYDHSLFVRRRLNNSIAQASATEGGGGAYMSPVEILKNINDNSRYVDSTNLSSE
jgi:hypothetical protein